jgi:hypothetical protein
MGVGVTLPALFHLKNRTDLELFPAFVSDVDHPTVQTDAFAFLLTIALLRHYRSFQWVSQGCLLDCLFNALTVFLGLSPDADTRNVAMPDTLEHF